MGNSAPSSTLIELIEVGEWVDVVERLHRNQRYPDSRSVTDWRLAHLAFNILCFASIFSADELQLIPLPALYGVFLLIGLVSLGTNAFWFRILVSFVPPSKDPVEPYTVNLRPRRIHLFAVLQLALFVVLFLMKSIEVIDITFPVSIALCIPIRVYLLPKILAETERIRSQHGGRNPRCPDSRSVTGWRLTHLVFNILCFASMFSPDELQLMPLPALYGVFLLFGLVSLGTNAFWFRILMFFMPPSKYPVEPYTVNLRPRRVHLFAVLQMALFVILYLMKVIEKIEITFPVTIALCIPIRVYLLPKILTETERIRSEHGGRTLLHVALEQRFVPFFIVWELLKDNPDSIRWVNDSGRNPLHQLCLNPTVDADYIEVLLSAKGAAKAAAMTDNDGRTPLHIACEEWGELSAYSRGGRRIELADRLIKRLLEIFPGASVVMDEDGETPAGKLWTGLRRRISVLDNELVSSMHRTYFSDISDEHTQAIAWKKVWEDNTPAGPKEQLLEKIALLIDAAERASRGTASVRGNGQERQLIHLTIRYARTLKLPAPAPFLKFLSRRFPELLTEQDESGRVPLHLASELPMEENERALKVLVKCCPTAATMKDRSGQLPFFSYLQSGCFSVEGANVIASAAPWVRTWRDSQTGLYAFMLAAAAASSKTGHSEASQTEKEKNDLTSVQTSYELLRADPHVLKYCRRSAA